ncbi:MAG: hypothetical protein ACXWV8_12915 [Chitinophagaceae bacterium]
MLKKKLYSIVFYFVIVLLFHHSGCTKEYSREGQVVIPPAVDSTPVVQLPGFPICSACDGRDSYEESRWSFKAGDSFLCGIMDTAFASVPRNAFTFFGPSACSADTNFVISVYLESYTFDRDQRALFIPKVSFYIAKNGASKFLLVSQPGTPFSVTIESYNHQTKMVIGTFSGHAYKPDGSSIFVHSGKFKVKLL